MAVDLDPFARRPYADTCVACLDHVVDPLVSMTAGGRADCLYLCPCGNTWSCSWSVGAVEGWEAA